MSVSTVVDISLGATYVGRTLNAQLVDSVGDDSGDPITTGFVEIGDGCYLLTMSVPDNFLGIVKVYEAGTTEILGIVTPMLADVRSALDAQGYTATRATYIDVSIASRHEAGAAVAIAANQTVATVTTVTNAVTLPTDYATKITTINDAVAPVTVTVAASPAPTTTSCSLTAVPVRSLVGWRMEIGPDNQNATCLTQATARITWDRTVTVAAGDTIKFYPAPSALAPNSIRDTSFTTAAKEAIQSGLATGEEVEAVATAVGTPLQEDDERLPETILAAKADITNQTYILPAASQAVYTGRIEPTYLTAYQGCRLHATIVIIDADGVAVDLSSKTLSLTALAQTDSEATGFELSSTGEAPELSYSGTSHNYLVIDAKASNFPNAGQVDFRFDDVTDADDPIPLATGVIKIEAIG